MKYHLAILLFFAFSSFLSQTTDTIKRIEGLWEFKSMSVIGDTTFETKKFHATTLSIENGQFAIGLSEAYAGGKFTENHNYVQGKYENGDQVFNEIRIARVKKNKLTIALTTDLPEYYGCSDKQNVIVYLSYKRIKLKK